MGGWVAYYQVLVRDGDTVQQGDALVVLEAMKMEHTVTAPCDGQVCMHCMRASRMYLMHCCKPAQDTGVSGRM